MAFNWFGLRKSEPQNKHTKDTLNNDKGYDTASVQQKSSGALPVYVQNYLGGTGAPSVSNNYTTFSTSDLVNSCVNYISETGGLTKFRILEVNSEGKRLPIRDKKVAELFSTSPSPYHTWQELTEQIIQSYLLTGNTYLNFEKLKKLELWYLRTDRMKIIPDSKNYIKSYQYDSRIEFTPNDIIHIRRSSPDNMYYGVPTMMDALRDPLLLEGYGISDLISFYQNSSVGSGVLSSKFNLNKQQIDTIREQFEKAYAGTNRHSAIILPNEMSYDSIKMSPKESMLLDSLNISDDRVLRAFKMHRILLGGRIDNYTTHTQEIAKLVFNTAIRPITEKIAGQLQLFFQQYLKNPNIVVVADYDKVPAMATNIAERADGLSKAFGSGILSLNEARDELGFPRIENENYDLHWLPSYLVGTNPTPVDSYVPGMELSPSNQQPAPPTTEGLEGGEQTTDNART